MYLYSSDNTEAWTKLNDFAQFLINHSDKKQEGQNIIYEGKDTKG